MDLPKYYITRRHFSAPPKNYRPVSAFPKSWSVIKSEFQHENNSLLYELMFKHGRQLEKFPFTFPRPPRLQSDHERSDRSNAWQCENKAFRQMHCMSARTPRRRMFSDHQVKVNTYTCRDDEETKDLYQERESHLRRAKSAPSARSCSLMYLTSKSIQRIT